ncbi:hypothetical protein FB45DRAFT_1136045 [Roridomyces roridus]|uniref:Uncharacterized protein n=1 Tax=Roridomyces roridus TaxID=1738132 RepID=A0AAD7FAC4_9AGAR|nr:hypothetical protein FB45DRAFT_1136045 [Roridomyces roridus]
MTDSTDTFEVPTSDPFEELEIPASDPYEEVYIPGFSQRDETREEVDCLIESLLQKSHRKAARRQELEEAAQAQWEVAAAATAARCADNKSTFESARPPPSPVALPTKRRRVSEAADSDDDTELDLLRLQYNDLEEERDEARDECNRLRDVVTKLEAKLQQREISGAFFRKETGRWRWAALNAGTRLDAAMRELERVLRRGFGAPFEGAFHSFGVKMVLVSDALKSPAGGEVIEL